MTLNNSDPVSVMFAGIEMDGIFINRSGEHAIVKLSSGYNICVPESFCSPKEKTASVEKPAVLPLKQDASICSL